MSETPAVVVPAPRRLGAARALLLWGAVLMISGIGIGVGATLLLHRPPPINETLPGGFDARHDGRPDFRVEPIVAQMSHELNLDEQQRKQVRSAYADSLAAIKGLRSDMIVKLSTEHEKLRDRLKAALTPLQFAQWDQRYEAMRGQMMPDGPPPRHGPPPWMEGRPPRDGEPPDGPPGPGGRGPEADPHGPPPRRLD